MRISDWSSDVCSSDLDQDLGRLPRAGAAARIHQLSPHPAGTGPLGLIDCCAAGKGASPLARFFPSWSLTKIAGWQRTLEAIPLLRRSSAPSIGRPAIFWLLFLVAASFISRRLPSGRRCTQETPAFAPVAATWARRRSGGCL